MLERITHLDELQLEWPLAAEHRAHVHEIIERHELPVTHQTRRTGSPYTLVSSKTKALFTREASERKVRASDLAWLRKSSKAFHRRRRVT
jgi:hypothetical protein